MAGISVAVTEDTTTVDASDSTSTTINIESTDATTAVSENVTTINIDPTVTTTTSVETVTTLNIVPTITTIEARGLAIWGEGATAAYALPCTPHGTVTATNVQAALEQLADQDFRTTSIPTGANVQEGDTWYDTDDNVIKVYRETSSGVFEWTNLVVTDADDTLDAGAF
jgi:hypothetical protein